MSSQVTREKRIVTCLAGAALYKCQTSDLLLLYRGLEPWQGYPDSTSKVIEGGAQTIEEFL